MSRFKVNVQLTDEEINSLDLSTKENRDRLIESFIPIASNIASRFKGIEYDEMQAQVLLGVVVAVDKLSRQDHANRGGYINRYIYQYCFKGLNNSREEYLEEQAVSFFNQVDFDDIINDIVETGREERIVELGKQGLNLKEISEETGLSRTTIIKVRKTLFSRYLKHV
jgi:DNA-directed RNA polymerase specialized sigma subunit